MLIDNSLLSSSRSLDFSVLRLESLPGAERSKAANMHLLQIVTDRQLSVVCDILRKNIICDAGWEAKLFKTKELGGVC